MGWADLLAAPETRTLPWLGGRDIYGGRRRWKIVGDLPPELGWHRFEMAGSKRARWVASDFPDVDFELQRPTLRGYLVGDRMIPDGAAVRPDVHAVFAQTEQVFMVEPGLERFSRALAARNGDGQLIYVRQEFPEGAELEVMEAWQDRKDDVDDIPGVTPALQLAFLWLTWQRMLTDERAEAVRLQAAAEAQAIAFRLAAEQRAKDLRAAIRDASSRRRLLHRSFDDAALAALAVSGAELLDTRDDYNGNKVVKFRFNQRRFECVCDPNTLRIVEAGICLTDSSTGEKGDDRFTLESLPAVIAEAMRTNVLHIYRHA